MVKQRVIDVAKKGFCIISVREQGVKKVGIQLETKPTHEDPGDKFDASE